MTDEKIEIIPLVSLYQQEVVGNLLWLIPLSFDPTVKFPIAIGDT